MGNPDFQLIKELLREEIVPHKIYTIPEVWPDSNPITHIGEYNGEYNYYYSSYPSDFKGISKKKSKRFYKIPNEATHFVFKDYKGNPGNPAGFIAGKPTFLPAAKTHEFYPSPFPGQPVFAT